MKFSDNLIRWYNQHKRKLPWRNTNDAYKIWMSEVILQQTRVEQGLGYYERIIARYPDIFRMADAKEEDLLKLWQGLGYYTRARNMLSAAQEIVTDYAGIFPQSFDEIIKIKGIGKYTAAAILSF
ncbi:MAG TPA: A/G-specific adenine glycosylase, partial [Bacteroidales bacterium]|nr:A/G-specific adenine glycosylase [Bacteroidales bacterium]